ncbi:tumor protein D54-like isoform X1 [Amphibalanus amphitrite]|uniref:tumor protein D54-like isoform X1 n=1 Tax=Amphibalanus amphitrite TaxID=1232801 RepID=UPI001C911165|nr:tumor protein D54-like isoform X1 [Amphibalanus amphitrite]
MFMDSPRVHWLGYTHLQRQSASATEMPATSPSADSGVVDAFSALSPEEQERQREEWKQDLARIEEDIVLMRETLSAKIKEAQELKHKLGITMWSEFTDDVNQGLKNVRESQAYHKVTDTISEIQHAVTEAPLYQAVAGKLEQAQHTPAYQRTEAALKTTTEKASGLLAGLGAKLTEARDSPTVKSLEERVGTMVTTVKSKVTSSRSNSTQSFDEALKEAEAAKRQAESAAPPPTVTEEKTPQ